MLKTYLHTTLLFGLSISVLGQRNLLGQFSYLGPHGKDIVLNSDSTFEYYWHTDIPDRNGKRDFKELDDPLATWTVRGDIIKFRIPDSHKDKEYDVELEILSDNVIKRRDSDLKWYRTKVSNENGNLKIEYKGLQVDENDNYVSYIYWEYQGNRTIQCEFINGVKQKSEMHFYENEKGRKLITVWGEWDKGLKNGSWTYTNDSGQVTEEQVWKKGKEHGKWNFYNDGQLRTIKVYKNGVLKSTRDI